MPDTVKRELLTDKNSVLVPANCQPAMSAGIASGDKAETRNSAYCAAKAAGIPGVPPRDEKIREKVIPPGLYQGEYI